MWFFFLVGNFVDSWFMCLMGFSGWTQISESWFGFVDLMLTDATLGLNAEYNDVGFPFSEYIMELSRIKRKIEKE